MKKIIPLFILILLLMNINTGICKNITSIKEMPVSLVHFFSTTQIVCPLNATSFPASIDVPLKVSGFNKITNAQGSISWDTSVIKYSYIANNGSAPAAFANTIFNINPAGSLTFSWTDLTARGITLSDSSFFCTIRFSIVGTFGNTSPFSLKSTPLYFSCTDSLGITSPVITNDGSVILTNGSNVVINSSTSFCQGDSTLLTSSVGTAYQWYFNGSPIITATKQTYFANTTGNYSVLTTQTNGCNTYSKNIGITAIAAPAAPLITASSLSICAGGTIILSSNLGSNYQWYLNGVAISGANSQNYTASTSGDYTATFNNTNGCKSSVSNTLKIAVNNTPSTPVITSKGPVSFCSNGYDTLTATPGSGYQWYFNGIAINGANNQTLIINNAGTYSVTTSNGTCNSAISNSITTTVTTISQPVIRSTGSSNLCPGRTVLLSTQAGNNYYQWYLNGVAIQGENGLNLTASAGGDYTVGAGTLGGCFLISNPATVTNIAITTPTITAGGNTTICTGSNVVLTSNNNNYTGYQWYLNGNAISGATNTSYTVTTTGSYAVITTNSNGCNSIVSNNIAVSVNPIPTVPVINAIGSTTICAGSSVSLYSSVANNYQWYFNGVAIANAANQSFSANTTGSYTVVVSNNSSCTASSAAAVVTVISKTTPTLSTVGSSSICQGNNLIINANIGYSSYQWYLNNILISGANSASYTANTSGTYTVTGTSSDGCTSNVSNSILLTVNSNPATPVLSANGNTSICSGNSVVLSTTAEYSYNWYMNGKLISVSSSPDYTVNIAGTYSVITTNINGCSSTTSNTITVSVTSPATPVITNTGSTSICNGDSVLLNTTGGTLYQWYFNGVKIINATSALLYSKSNGNYSVEVTYANGCSAVSGLTAVTVITNPTPVISYTKLAICPGSNIVLDATSGFTGYQWYYNGNPIVGANSVSYLATIAGNFTVIGTGKFGCKSSVSIPVTTSISSTPTTPAITANGNTSFCPGGNVNLSSSNTNYNSYQWYFNGNSITGATNQSYIASNAGNYTVSATNADGCISGSSAITKVTNYPTPSTPIIYTNSATNNICAGNSILLSSSSAYTYQWYLNSVAITNATGQTYTGYNGGNYAVTVTNNYGCSTTSLITSVNIINKTTPIVTVNSSTSFCAGNKVRINTSGYYTYQWYLNGNPINGATNTYYDADTTGNYTVIGYTIEGCNSYTSAPVFTTVYSNPATPSLSLRGPSTICSGNFTTLQSSRETSYSWYLNGILLNNGNTPNYTVTNGGNYTVAVTNSNGCTSPVSNTINVTVIIPPTPTISASGSTTVCSGDSVMLTTVNGNTYQWYFNGIKITNDTLQSIYASFAGNYSVEVTYPSGCKAISNNVYISIYTTNTPSVLYNSTIICPGSSNTLLANTGFVAYQWYYNGLPIINANSATYAAMAAGNYSVTVSSNGNCFSNKSATVQLIMGTTPATPIITAGNTNFCKGDTINMVSSSSYNYQWYFNGNQILGANNRNIYATQSGNYTVAAIDQNGCISSPSAINSIQQYPYTQPYINSIGSTNICAGNSVGLIASSGINYLWYNNGNSIPSSNTQNYTVSAAGNYTVKVLDAYGCSYVSNSIAVAVETVPAPIISMSNSGNICAGDSTNLYASNGYNSYQWYNNNIPMSGSIYNTITVKNNGNYTVTGTSNSGCKSVASIAGVINVFSNPGKPTLTASAAGLCDGGNVVLTASSGTSFQWYMNGNAIIGANSQTFTAYVAGNYSVIVYNAGGCQSVLSNVINVVNYSTIPSIGVYGKTNLCFGESTSLYSSIGSSYQWYMNNNIISGATAQTYITNNPGTYTVAVTNSNNCTSFTSGITVTVTTVPTPTLTTSANVVCNGNTATLSSSQGYAYYQWYNNGIVVPGITTINYVVGTSGNYTVVGTHASGCISAASNPVKFTVANPTAIPIINYTGYPAALKVCTGSNAVLSSNIAASNYQWYLNGNAIPTANGATYSTGTQGDYSLVVTDSNGCKSAVSYPATNLSLLPVPAVPTIINTGNSILCPNLTVTLTASSAIAYQWFYNGSLLLGATTQTLNVTLAGNYTVQVFNANQCGTSSLATNVKSNNAKIPTVAITGNTTFCKGSFVNLTAFADSGYILYQWYNNNNIIPGATNRTYRADSSGTYTVVATIPGGCSTYPSANIVVNTLSAPAIPTVTPYGRVFLCKNTVTTLTATLANNYQWYRNGAVISGAINQTYSISDTGYYAVSVTNAIGCTSYSTLNASAFTKDTNNVAIANTAKTNFCKGDSSILTASAGYTYQWYYNNSIIVNATSQNYTATKSGSYNVYAIDSNSCYTTSNKITIAVVSSASPTLVTSGPTTYCSGNVNTILSGAPGYTYYMWYKNDTLISGATSSTYTPTTSGTYTLVAYNLGDCPSTPSSSVGITVVKTPAKPVVARVSSAPYCDGKNELLIGSGVSGVSYQWYKNGVAINGASNQTYNTPGPGNYSMQVINNGCSSLISDSLPIIRQVAAGFTTNNVSQELCINNFVFTSSSVSSKNTYYWDFGDTTNSNAIHSSHMYNRKGNFTVKQIVMNADRSCMDSATQTVAVIKCTYNGINEQDSVKVYPNPTNGIFKVNVLSTVSRNARMAVVGADNGVIYLVKDLVLQEGKNIVNMNMSSPMYKNGTYIVRVIGDNMDYTVQRFVLVH